MNVVLLVGDSNVGKSTIFNRLVGKHEAVTHKSSGTTVDILQGISKDCSYFVFDTPGVDLIDVFLKDFLKKYFQKVDLILFVVDIYKGVCFKNEELLNLLRKKKCLTKTFLILNKIDKVKDYEIIFNEFRSLGIKDIFCLSAEHNINISFLNEIIKQKISEKKILKDFSVTILGRSNSGKSSLFNSLLKYYRSSVNNNIGTTRDCVKSIVKYNDKFIEFIDTPGYQKKYKDIEYFCTLRREETIKKSYLILFTIDCQMGLNKIDKNKLHSFWKRSKNVLIVVTKFDTINIDELDYKNYIKKNLLNVGFDIVFTSSKENFGVDKIFKKIVDFNSSFTFDEKLLNDILLCAFNNQKPFNKHREIKIFGIQQYDKLNFDIYTNHPKLIKESYTRYLSKQIKCGLNLLNKNISIKYKKSKIDF